MTKGFVLLFALAFLITSSLIVIKPAFIAGVPSVKAETVIETTASISAEPNPVGVGQIVQLNMLIEPPPPTPTDRFSGLIINITRPDNATEMIGPYLSDSNGSACDIYLPVKYGIYKFQLNYPGESFTGDIVYRGATSAITTLNVTQEPQPTPTPSPTPEPTPNVPEFQSWIILPFFITATLAGWVFHKKKRAIR